MLVIKKILLTLLKLLIIKLKIMKKILFLLAIAIFSATFITSCKKGEDDPFISFRSRDNRIIGVWVLKNKTYTRKEQTVTKTTNNVNSNTYNSDETTTNTNTFDGTNYVEKSVDDNKYNNSSTNYDWISNSFTTTSSESKNVYTTNDTYTYSVEVEIKDDHTYSATYTKTNVKETTSSSYTSGGQTTTTETDTTYSPQDTKTWTEEGNWFWLDSNDDKIYISAGPLSGVLKKLSNKEIVIETLDNYSSTNTTYSNDSLYTYTDINNPYKRSFGVTTTTKTQTTNTSDLTTWEAKK